MARVQSEQAVLVDLENLVKQNLGHPFQPLDTAKAKQSMLEEFCTQATTEIRDDGQEEKGLEDVRKRLARICSRMSLSILDRIYPIEYGDEGENKGQVLPFDAEDVIVRMKILRNYPGDRKQLAWAKLALDICEMIVDPEYAHKYTPTSNN